MTGIGALHVNIPPWRGVSEQRRAYLVSYHCSDPQVVTFPKGPIYHHVIYRLYREGRRYRWKVNRSGRRVKEGVMGTKNREGWEKLNTMEIISLSLHKQQLQKPLLHYCAVDDEFYYKWINILKWQKGHNCKFVLLRVKCHEDIIFTKFKCW